MGRGLTTAQKNYTGPMWWAAEFTLRSGAIQRFCEGEVLWSGNSYLPYLLPPENVLLPLDAETLETASLTLSNADRAVGALISAETFRDADVVLKQLLLGINSEITILRGRVVEQGPVGDVVNFTVNGRWRIGEVALHARNFGPLCGHRFAAGGCGYRQATATWAVTVAERTASSIEANGITDSTAAWSVDAYKDLWCFVREGTTGKGQVRRIASNTATALTFYQPWVTAPSGTVKFEILTFTDGAPAPLLTSTTARLERTATGGAASYIEDTALSMTTDEHAGRWVRITAGTGSGQLKKIASNSATRLTLASGYTFSPAPSTDSVFRVLYAKCNLDFYQSCEERARSHEYSGFPTLTQIVKQNFIGEEVPGGVVGYGFEGGVR
ncbi:MAG TPA: hypothetical protein VNL38_02130 [Candidatus Nitrosotenuis sp.]|nr:hypothetical protein [Candidatus Nitrosotenuis sp.]